MLTYVKIRLPATEKKSGTLWFRYKQVSLYKLYRILRHIAWGVHLVVPSEVDRSRTIN